MPKFDPEETTKTYGERAEIVMSAAMNVPRPRAKKPPLEFAAINDYVQNYYITGPNTSTGSGRNFGAWLTSTRALAISDATIASGSPIYNPVGVIESIIQDELITRQGFSFLDVDTDSFDAAYDDRPASSWRFDCSIISQTKAVDLLDELAIQCGCKIWLDYDKKFKIKAFDSTDAIQYYFYGEPTQFQESVNRGRILGNPLITHQPLDSIYNKFKVWYAYDYARDKYSNHVYVNSTDSNWSTVTDTTAVGLCNSAEDNYHINQEYIFEASFIQDKETAERLCNYFCSRFSRRLAICTFQTLLEGIKIERGDIINIQHPKINRYFTSYATMKWEVYNIVRSGIVNRITAIEV